MSTDKKPEVETLMEVIPKTGLVYSEKSTMVELLCRPKLMAIKSAALLRLEELDKQAVATLSAGSKPLSATGMVSAAPSSSMGRANAAKRL